MPFPHLFDPDDPNYMDPFAPFMQQEETPEMPPPVDIPDENEETPTAAVQPTSLPRNILPFNNLPSPSLQDYEAHISAMPQREDYRASVGRRILASLAGAATGFRNPGEGINVAERITQQPYEQAVSDWSTKGKSLEAAAAQEGKTLGESVDYNLGLIKDETQRGNLKARVDQIQKNYEIGMKNAKTAQERAAILQKAQSDMAQYHRDIIGVRKTEAGASVTQAEAAKTRAGASVTSAEASKARAEKAAQPKTLSSIDQLRVMRTAQDAVRSEMPEAAAKYIETDDNGKVIGWKSPSHWYGGARGWTPEEQMERNKLIKRYNEIRAEALKELNTRSITEEPPPYIPD